MKGTMFGLTVLAIVGGWLWYQFCPPPPPTPVPTVTIASDTPQPPNTPVPPTLENTPTLVPLPTPTNIPTNTVLVPSDTPIPTGTPGLTFTITVKPPSPEGHDTPTPTKRTYYTYTPKSDPTSPACFSGDCGGLMIDTDTLLDNKTLRIRFFNNGGNMANLMVKVSLTGGTYQQRIDKEVPSKTTGDAVFEIPCEKSATAIRIETTYPGYTAVQMIQYPTCICN